MAKHITEIKHDPKSTMWELIKIQKLAVLSIKIAADYRLNQVTLTSKPQRKIRDGVNYCELATSYLPWSPGACCV